MLILESYCNAIYEPSANSPRLQLKTAFNYGLVWVPKGPIAIQLSVVGSVGNKVVAVNAKRRCSHSRPFSSSANSQLTVETLRHNYCETGYDSYEA